MKGIGSKIIKATFFAFMMGMAVFFAACSDGSDSGGGANADEKQKEQNLSTDAVLNMVNTTYTEDKVLETTTEFSNFGAKAYLVYTVPVTKSSSRNVRAYQVQYRNCDYKKSMWT